MSHIPITSRRSGCSRIALSVAAVACFVLTAGVDFSFAQDSCCECEANEPCLKFLDDLFYGSPQSFRDPYEEPIETDRHDFTQSAGTVGRGVVQLEGGYSYFYKDGAEEIEQSHTGPEMLLRLGLSEDIEFRVRWTYAWVFKSAKDEEEELQNLDGAQDLIWGFKLQLTEQECCLPRSALRLVSTVPTGGNDFTTDGVEIGADVVYSWELSNGWTLAGSTGVFGNGAGEFSLTAFGGMEEAESLSDFTAWAQSVAVGIPLSARSELYLEYFGIFTDGLPDEATFGFINAGVDYLITDDLVFDVRVGRGLTDDSDDFFAGIGGGVRY